MDENQVYTSQEVEDLIAQIREDVDNKPEYQKMNPWIKWVFIIISIFSAFIIGYSLASTIDIHNKKKEPLYIFHRDPYVVDQYGKKTDTAYAGDALYTSWDITKLRTGCFTTFSGSFLSKEGLASFTFPIRAGTISGYRYENVIFSIEIPKFLPTGNYVYRLIFREECPGYEINITTIPDIPFKLVNIIHP